MQFTQIPNHYAPLGGELRYAVGQQTASDIDIRIFAAGDDASILTTGDNAGIPATGDDASILTTGDNTDILSAGENANIPAAGDKANIPAAGNIRSTGENANIPAAGNDSILAAGDDTGNLSARENANIPAAGNIRSAGENAGILLGAKRFAGVTEAAFDAAPYLRRALRFLPATGGTGFHSADGRMVRALVQAAETENETASVLAPERTFLPGSRKTGAPGVLTSMPTVRLIPEGACDELTLLADDGCAVTVTAQAAKTTTAEHYPASGAGLYLFRLDTRDFPGAESLTVDAGACGTVVYRVIPAVTGAVRLAWRSSAGSIEHYTFPVVRTTTLRVAKRLVEGPEGRLVAATETDRETLLASAYESRAVLEALAELTASPDIWIAEGDTYTPVLVASDEAVVHRHGSLSMLEIAIRPKSRTTWN